MKAVLVVLASVVGGTVAGYRFGLWWLHQTVESPELETAIYPVAGAIVGGVVGLAAGLFLTVGTGTRGSSESSGEGVADETGGFEPDPPARR